MAPSIDKSVLRGGVPVTDEYVGVAVLGYGSDEVVLREWDWRNLVANPNAPSELPAEYVEMLRVEAPEYVRDDPQLWKGFLARTLEAYKESRARILQGTIRVTVVRADSPEAVYRWWICDALMCSLPVDAIKWRFAEGNKLALGTVAYGRTDASSALIYWARNNVGVKIGAEGGFAAEASAVAGKIDALIVQQPILTPAELAAMRPEVELGDTVVVERTGSIAHRFLPFRVSAPAGQRIIRTLAWVDGDEGDRRGIRDGRIVLDPPTKSPVTKISLRVITDGLMARTVEKEIAIGP